MPKKNEARPQSRLEITYRTIAELKPAEYNPRRLTEKQFADLKKSLEKLDAIDPAIINTHPGREDVIISGHQRIKVAEALGWTEFPCVHVSFPPEKEREANVRLNKNTGEWDWDILANEFDGNDLKSWGFDEKEIPGVVDPVDIPEDIPEDFTEVNEQIKTEHECPKCGYRWSGGV